MDWSTNMAYNRILVVEDSASPGWLSWPRMNHAPYDVEILAYDDSVLERVRRAPLPDIVILNIEDIEIGVDFISRLRRIKPQLKVIALLPEGDYDIELASLQTGANICAWKPCDDQTLNNAIERCLAGESETSELETVLERPGDVEELGNGRFFVMASPAMRRLRGQVDQVAGIDVPILILGESGTGKEVVARLIHGLSRRSQRPFLKVNCAALPSELLESELFGYERGAFTGAVRAKPGMFELCNNGTLLLDEIAEMPPNLQAKLLHFLQDQEFSRLGSCSRIKVNVRVLAATNVNIKAAIAAKAFREDLYYRLSTFVFLVPPLRERKEDIRVLFSRYMKFHAGALCLPPRVVTKDVWALCSKYHWPGNVRELENLAKRYIICGEDALGISGALAHSVGGSTASNDCFAGSSSGDLKAHMRDVRTSTEALAISQALDQTNWNRREAAKILQISYKSVLSKIRLYGLDQMQRKSADQYKLGSSGSAYRVQTAK